MKTVMIALLACAFLATVAFAAEVGLYPPEYAPLFAEEMAVTPEDAIAAVASCHDSFGANIFKPITLKCVNGITAGYIVLAYKGDDPESIKTIKYLVEEFNKDDIKNIKHVMELLSKLSNNRNLYTFIVSAWRWDPPILAIICGGSPEPFCYLPKYIERAQLDINQLESIRFLYSSPTLKRKNVLCAKTKHGEDFYFGSEERLSSRTAQDLYEVYLGELSIALSFFDKDKEYTNSNISAWDQVDADNVDVRKHFKDGCYRFEEPVEGYDEIDGSHIYNISDPLAVTVMR